MLRCDDLFTDLAGVFTLLDHGCQSSFVTSSAGRTFGADRGGIPGRTPCSAANFLVHFDHLIDVRQLTQLTPAVTCDEWLK